MLGARQSPKRSLLFNIVNKDHQRRGRVAENSSIALRPNLPGDEHHQRSKRPGGFTTNMNVSGPPFLHRAPRHPSSSIDVMHAKPLEDIIPHAKGKTTLEQKVGC